MMLYGILLPYIKYEYLDLTIIVLYSTILHRRMTMIETKGGFIISQIKQIQGRIFEKLLTEAGIDDFNGPQGRILYVLWKEDNISIVDIARRTGLAKTTLTSMLDRMEKQGHIKRCFDESDRRKIRIRLTDKAIGLMDQYNIVSNEMNQIFYKGFSDDEIRSFEQQLERVLMNLKGE